VLFRFAVFLNAGGHTILQPKKDLAKSLFVQAWELARSDATDDIDAAAWDFGTPLEMDALAVDAAHMVAIASMGTDDAINWNKTALELAQNSSQEGATKWRAALLKNVDWAHHDRGQYEDAVGNRREAALWFGKAVPLLSQMQWLVEQEPERIKRHEALAQPGIEGEPPL